MSHNGAIGAAPADLTSARLTRQSRQGSRDAATFRNPARTVTAAVTVA